MNAHEQWQIERKHWQRDSVHTLDNDLVSRHTDDLVCLLGWIFGAPLFLAGIVFFFFRG